jgi:predicted PurR-regulated permease PerM
VPHTHERDRTTVIDQGFAVSQRWGLRIIVLAIALYILGWAVGHTWAIWYPVLMALLLSSVLAPPVTWLRKRKVPAAASAAMVMLGFLGVIVLVMVVIAPQVAGQLPDIATSASSGLTQVRDWVVDGPMNVTEAQINDAVVAMQDRLQSSAAAISAGVFSTISAATSAVVNIVLVLILTFLFIKDGHRFLPWVASVGGHRAGGHLTEVLLRVWNTIGGFIRTQALVSLIDAVFIGLGLVIIGVPLAIPLALLTFFGGFIPIVGAFATGGLAVLVTLVTNSPRDALIVLAIIVVVQQLEGNVLSPWLQGKSMNLHAAVVLMSVTAGGTMFGITGAFLAVPVAAAAAEVLRYLDERVGEVAVEPDEVSTDDPVPAGDETAVAPAAG